MSLFCVLTFFLNVQYVICGYQSDGSDIGSNTSQIGSDLNTNEVADVNNTLDMVNNPNINNNFTVDGISESDNSSHTSDSFDLGSGSINMDSISSSGEVNNVGILEPSRGLNSLEDNSSIPSVDTMNKENLNMNTGGMNKDKHLVTDSNENISENATKDPYVPDDSKGESASSHNDNAINNDKPIIDNDGTKNNKQPESNLDMKTSDESNKYSDDVDKSNNINDNKLIPRNKAENSADIPSKPPGDDFAKTTRNGKDNSLRDDKIDGNPKDYKSNKLTGAEKNNLAGGEKSSVINNEIKMPTGMENKNSPNMKSIKNPDNNGIIKRIKSNRSAKNTQKNNTNRIIMPNDDIEYINQTPKKRRLGKKKRITRKKRRQMKEQAENEKKS